MVIECTVTIPCELQGRGSVVSRYAGIAVFHAAILNLTYDTRQPRIWRGFRGRAKTYPSRETRQGALGFELD